MDTDEEVNKMGKLTKKHNDGLAESEEAIKALQESLAEKEEELAKKNKIIKVAAEDRAELCKAMKSLGGNEKMFTKEVCTTEYWINRFTARAEKELAQP